MIRRVLLRLTWHLFYFDSVLFPDSHSETLKCLLDRDSLFGVAIYLHSRECGNRPTMPFHSNEPQRLPVDFEFAPI